jgi:hypothetical protein
LGENKNKALRKLSRKKRKQKLSSQPYKIQYKRLAATDFLPEKRFIEVFLVQADATLENSQHL